MGVFPFKSSYSIKFENVKTWLISQWLHRCWWRMLETVYVVTNINLAYDGSENLEVEVDYGYQSLLKVCLRKSLTWIISSSATEALVNFPVSFLQVGTFTKIFVIWNLFAYHLAPCWVNLTRLRIISRFPAVCRMIPIFQSLPMWILSVTPKILICQGAVYDWCSLDYLKNPWDQATVDFRPWRDESQMRKNWNGCDTMVYWTNLEMGGNHFYFEPEMFVGLESDKQKEWEMVINNVWIYFPRFCSQMIQMDAGFTRGSEAMVKNSQQWFTCDGKEKIIKFTNIESVWPNLTFSGWSFSCGNILLIK